MFGERLRLARKKAGLSLRDLSAQLDDRERVSAQAIGKYERGAMTPSSKVLLALSKALGEPVRYFMSPIGANLLSVDSRKTTAASLRDRARVEAAVLDLVDRYLTVEEILNMDSAEWDEPFKPTTLVGLQDAEKLADQVRAAWQLGLDPIADMTELLEEHGIKVIMIELPDRVSGLTCLVGRSGNRPSVPVIVVNSNLNIERRRMTLAHELALRVISPESTVDEDKLAMRFAGAFLMPGMHVRAEVGSCRHSLGYRELIALKHLYRVSAAAILVRLEQIGIISHSSMIHVFRTIGRTWRKAEPLPIEDNVEEKTDRFERLCFRALSEDLISQAKAVELLGRTSVEILQELTGPRSDAGNR